MNGRRRARNTSAGLILVTVAASLFACTPDARKPVPAARESRLEQREGVSVLILEGTPTERGRAHGRLLAREIVDFVSAFEECRPDAASLASNLAKFSWDADAKAELDGIFAGVQETLGQDAKVGAKGRPFVREDLDWINLLADLLPFGCSSFTVAGDRVEGGGTLTARNLDYQAVPGLLAHKLVVVETAREHRHGWVSVSWPGLIGGYTGMNDEGLTASIHDVATGHETLAKGEGFTPRTIGVRALLERTDAGDGWPERAASVLRGCPVVFGNNIHVSAPRGHAGPPGVVLEWDPDRTRDGGVTIRDPGSEPLICTNHWRARRAPEPCSRYASLEKLLSDGAKKWTPEAAFEALREPAFGDSKGDVPHQERVIVGLQVSATAVVERVSEGSPAARAGVLAGDKIVAIDDTAVASMRECIRCFMNHAPGTTATLIVERDGARKTLPVTVGAGRGLLRYYYVTLHSVVFSPESRSFQVAFAGRRSAPFERPVAFHLDELLAPR